MLYNLNIFTSYMDESSYLGSTRVPLVACTGTCSVEHDVSIIAGRDVILD